MSLLRRIEQGEGAQRGSSRLNREQDLKKSVREQLYEQIPAARIAKMVSDNPAAARKELAAAIDRILNQDGAYVSEGEEGRRLRAALLNDILGLGPLEPLLNDPTVTEIMVNGPESVFYEREGRLYQWQGQFDDDEHVMRVIERIVAPLGRRVDERSPMVNARLPEGHRVNVIIPPLAIKGPTITVRKFRTALFDLQELVSMGSLTEDMAEFLSWAVKARSNIAVTGGTGSGKTTLLNALSIEIPETERLITVEDSAELRFHRHPHVVSLEARPSNIEGEGEVSIRDLVINTLRMRPDRIVVGEVRGGEALDMLQAMNTGHDGSLTTLHANSPQEAISRLATMVRYVAELPIDAIHEQIAGAIDLIVHQSRMQDGTRKVTAIVEVEGVDKGDIVLRPVVRFVQAGIDDSGAVLGHYEKPQTPQLLARFEAQGLVSAEEVAAWRSSKD